MNRLISYAATVVLVTMLSGCSAATKTIMSKSQSERTDVFKEVTGPEPIPAGFADVTIKASIKTHLERGASILWRVKYHGGHWLQRGAKHLVKGCKT